MTSRHKPINLIAIAVTTALLLAACKDKDPFTNQQETAAPAVTEDKITQLQREAQAGDPDAQYNLAYLYENGLGVAKDEAKALDLYQQAADQGHPEAQNSLNAKKAH